MMAWRRLRAFPGAFVVRLEEKHPFQISLGEIGPVHGMPQLIRQNAEQFFRVAINANCPGHSGERFI